MFKRVLSFFKNKIAWDATSELPYRSLSPVNSPETTKEYVKALDWAIENRKKHDIKNIALTGPYGSGKSSILKTYIESNKDKKKQFLNISLATFKEEIDEATTSVQKDDLLRRIELSILQQIFYHEKDSSIPDSRFRKIKHFSKIKLISTASFIFILGLSIWFVIDPVLFQSIFKVSMPEWTSSFLHYISLTVISVAFLWISYNSVRFLNSIKISKLNIQNAEIEVGDKINKSILNHHFDEILYFFEVTDYNIVIIEDLDRFQKTEIFTKLREINLLINSSKKIKGDVVFIYAVRDDMFKGQNERTKFFDFIIPVVPIINPSNSSQKLLEKSNLFKYGISETLIDSISFFIDDMRLLNNIVNEFYMYKKILHENLSKDKLLGIMLYKNLFPGDFYSLANNSGILYKCFGLRSEFIEKRSINIDVEIASLTSRIEKLEGAHIGAIKELRLIYLAKAIDSMPGFKNYLVGGASKTIEEMASDNNFQEFQDDNITYYKHTDYSTPTSFPIRRKFREIEKLINPHINYSQREEDALSIEENSIDSLKNDIHNLQREKIELTNSRIQTLIDYKVDLQFIKEDKHRHLLNVLLKNGFIDEDYNDYISIFYEGSITKTDYQFLINIKMGVQTPFDYTLTKVENLIKKIDLNDFRNPNTLNIGLLDFVLVSKHHIHVRDEIIFKLSDETSESILFIDQFISKGMHLAEFIRLLHYQWRNLWNFIDQKSKYPSDKIDKYLSLVLSHSEIDDLKIAYSQPSFRKSILSKPDFGTFLPDADRIEQIISQLRIKFTNIDLSAMPNALRDFIIENNYYEININMLRKILLLKKVSPEAIEQKNYNAVLDSESPSLTNYISSNLPKYIKDVYLKLEQNIYEEQDAYIKLLEAEGVNSADTEAIIEQVKTLVHDISQVSIVDVRELLLIHKKMKPRWNNILWLYNDAEQKITSETEEFLNDVEIAKQLSKDFIHLSNANHDMLGKFSAAITQLTDLPDDIYELLITPVPFEFGALEFTEFNEAKVAILINKGKLSFNQANFEKLRDHFPDLLIKQFEYHKADFLKAPKAYEIPVFLFNNILESSKFTHKEKKNWIEIFDESIFLNDETSQQLVGELWLKDHSISLSKQLIKNILINKRLSIEQRISILIPHYENVGNDFYDTFLIALGEPYSEITVHGKRPVIPDNEYNRALTEVLKTKVIISKYDFQEKGIRISTFKNG